MVLTEGVRARRDRELAATIGLERSAGASASVDTSPQEAIDGFGCSRQTAGLSDSLVRWRVPVFCIRQLF